MTRHTRKIVACDGCTLCCRNDAIVLHPEDGDDPAQYRTTAIPHPLTGRPVLMLAKAADGNCVYLDPASGCTIHDRAPAVCRTFSCADMYQRMGAARLRRLVQEGSCTAEVVDMGRKRLRAQQREAHT